MESTEETVPTEEQTAMGISDKIMNVFAAPGELFDDVARTEKTSSNWIVPICVSLLMSLIFTFVVFNQPAIQSQMMDQQSKALQKRVADGKMTQDQYQMAVENNPAKPGTPFFLIFAAVGVVVVTFGMLFLFALGFWLAGKFIMKSPATYGKHVEVVGLSLYISAVGTMVTMIMVVMMGSLHATPSLALAVADFDPTNSVHKLLSSVNVLTFWGLFIISVGLSKIWNVTLVKSLSVVGTMWLIWALVSAFVNFGM